MWKEENNKLKKSFIFDDFTTAFAFMTRVAKFVDRMDHHPWWANMYNQVHFELCTHDAGDIVTDKDRTLADAIDKIYEEK
jgi:4a-hydroxytetrahydrobiopterin dehydratase